MELLFILFQCIIINARFNVSCYCDFMFVCLFGFCLQSVSELDHTAKSRKLNIKLNFA